MTHGGLVAGTSREILVSAAHLRYGRVGTVPMLSLP